MEMSKLIINTIKKIDEALTVLMVEGEDEHALIEYNHNSEVLEDLLMKVLVMGYNPHNDDVDRLTKDERNIFDNALKNVDKKMLIINYN